MASRPIMAFSIPIEGSDPWPPMPPTSTTGMASCGLWVRNQRRLSPMSGMAQMIPSTCRARRLLSRPSTSSVSGRWSRFNEIE